MPKGIYKRIKPSHRKGVRASKETRLKQSLAQKRFNQLQSRKMCIICLINLRASINSRTLYCIRCRKEIRRITHNKATIKWHNQRMKTDLNYKLRKYFSYKINKQLKRRFIHKARRISIQYLSYTIDDLIKHLESKFKKGMSWKNYGKWHIDHIIPETLFNYKDLGDSEFQKCWALSNLQPLWALENIRKGNRLQ